MLFEKPSLRTRLSFETAMTSFGGNAIYYSADEGPFGKKENVKDTAMCAAQYVDAFVLRLKSRESLLEFVKYSKVPVINALDDWAHPCQILADLFTIAELKLNPKPLHENHLNFDRLKMAYYGDCRNNVTYDLMRAAAMMNFKLVLSCPDNDDYKPVQEVWDEIKRINEKSVEWIENPLEASKGCDVIYTDSWMSYHIPESMLQTREQALKNYQVNMPILKNAKSDVIFMHCLPAKRSEEVTDEVMDSVHSVIYHQAWNRQWAQQALLLYVIYGPSIFSEHEYESELLSEEKYFAMAPKHLGTMHSISKKKHESVNKGEKKYLKHGNKERILISFGGNALQSDSTKEVTYEDLHSNIDKNCSALAKFLQNCKQSNICITHGNGPQVGFIHKELNHESQMPLDVCGAMSQSFIGYQFQQSLMNNMHQQDTKGNVHVRSVTTLITQTLVDQNDKAFQHPNKPVGKFLSPEEYESSKKDKQMMTFHKFDEGYRRVVPSPTPIDIIELDTIKTLFNEGHLVICNGGGGIPVVKSQDEVGGDEKAMVGKKQAQRKNHLMGVEAVIDKDRSSSLLAQKLTVDYFIILTKVDHVYLNYSSKEEKKKPITSMDVETARQYITEGCFEEGTMLPKIESATEFVTKTGKPALITSLDNFIRETSKQGDVNNEIKLRHIEGTWIVP